MAIFKVMVRSLNNLNIVEDNVELQVDEYEFACEVLVVKFSLI